MEKKSFLSPGITNRAGNASLEKSLVYLFKSNKVSLEIELIGFLIEILASELGTGKKSFSGVNCLHSR